MKVKQSSLHPSKGNQTSRKRSMAASFWQDGQGREQKRTEFGASLSAQCSRHFTSANTHRPVLQSSSRRPTSTTPQG